MGLEAMDVRTYAPDFARLTGITPTIPQEEVGNLNKITKYLLKSIMELSQQQGIKIPERKEM